jgi:glycine betaine/proline transport system permease protein
MIDGIYWFLALIPVILFVVIVVVLAWWIAGKGLAIFTA